MKPRVTTWGVPIGTLLVSVLFLVWALRTPRLEKVWKTQLALRLGDQEVLPRGDFEDLQQALEDYPGLASDLTKGQHAGLISRHEEGRVRGRHAYLIRRAGKQIELQVSYAYPRQSGEVQVEAHSVRARWRGVSRPGTPLRLEFGKGVGPELIEIQLSEESRNGASRMPSVQIDWVEVTP